MSGTGTGTELGNTVPALGRARGESHKIQKMPTFIRKRSAGFGRRPFSGRGVMARSVRRRLFRGNGVRNTRMLRRGWGGVAAFTAANLVHGTRTHSTYMRRLKARRQVGERVGLSPSKWEISEVGDTMPTKTLNRVYRLLPLTKGANAATNDERMRSKVNFRGVKVCAHLRLGNVSGQTGKKMWFNWAVISPKAEDNEITSIPEQDFFRGQSDGRNTDFSAALSGLDLHCLGINTDKYIIHRHKRMTVGPWESTEGKGEMYFEEYIKVGRQIRYNDDGSTTALRKLPEGKDMWIVYWGAYMDEPGGTAIGAAYTVNMRIHKVFRESKN